MEGAELMVSRNPTQVCPSFFFSLLLFILSLEGRDLLLDTFPRCSFLEFSFHYV